MLTVEYTITNTADDVCYIGGYLYDSPVVVGDEASYGAKTYAGMLFRNLGIPQGATITSATLTLKRVNPAYGTSWGRFYGVAQDSIAAWPLGSVESLPVTSQYTTVKSDATGVHDVTAIVQAIVNGAGFSGSSNIGFVADPTTASGYITWEDYSASSTDCAKLSITYTEGEDTSPTDTTAPVITSADSGQIVVGGAFSLSLTANEAVTWSILTGTGFSLSGNTLTLTNSQVEGIYTSTVRATDTAGNYSDQNITVTVSAAPDATAPTITNASTGATNQGVAFNLSLTADEPVVWTKMSGNDFTLSGSTLTLPSTVSAGSYEAVVRATDLAGNYRQQTITITVAAPPQIGTGGIEFVGSSAGVRTATMPPHQPGDHISVFAYAHSSGSAVVLPAGYDWTEIRRQSSFSSGATLGTKIAKSSFEEVGTFPSNTTAVLVCVHRPTGGASLLTGLSAGAGATGNHTPIVYPALALDDPSGASWVVGLGGARNPGSGERNATPSGMVTRILAVDANTRPASMHDTDGGVSEWLGSTIPTVGLIGPWQTITFEIKVVPAEVSHPPEPIRKQVRHSYWL